MSGGKLASEILPIPTLNARGKGMPEVICDDFGRFPDRMLLETKECARTLKAECVNTDDLRAASGPDRGKLEIALILGTMRIEDRW